MTKHYFTLKERVMASKVTQTRSITIQTDCYPVNNPNKPPIPIPKITFRGHWLAKAGFRIGTPITLYVMDDCLVLMTNQPPQ